MLRVIGDKTYSPQEITAMILRSEAFRHRVHRGRGHRRVITVPPTLPTAAPNTRDAGLIAGLNVLRIINEPTAALAYLKSQRHMHSGGLRLWGGNLRHLHSRRRTRHCPRTRDARNTALVELMWTGSLSSGSWSNSIKSTEWMSRTTKWSCSGFATRRNVRKSNSHGQKTQINLPFWCQHLGPSISGFHSPEPPSRT